MNQLYNFTNFYYFYIAIYTIFLICRYSVFSDIIYNKPIKIISFNIDNPNFIVKRILQLSLITLLFSSITFLFININLYIISLILHIVVIIGYGVYFSKKNIVTYIIHIILAFPIFILPFYTDFSGDVNYIYILLLLIFLLFYKLYLFTYVYPM